MTMSGTSAWPGSAMGFMAAYRFGSIDLRTICLMCSGTPLGQPAAAS